MDIGRHSLQKEGSFPRDDSYLSSPAGLQTANQRDFLSPKCSLGISGVFLRLDSDVAMERHRRKQGF